MTLLMTRPPAEKPGPVRRTERLRWLLAAGWFAQVCVRLWLARARVAPAADPDETGYLVAARWLAGGPGADLSGNTLYQGAYPLLLAPVHAATHDPATVYTAVMVINALVGALAFPLGYLAARRLGLSRRTALPSAWAAALLPAATFFGAFALADAVLPVLVLGWILALDRHVRLRSAHAAVGATLVAVYASAAHSRGLVVLAVHAAVLIVLAVRGRGRRASLIGLGLAAAGQAAVTAFNGLVAGALYPSGHRDLAANVTDRLTSVDGLAWASSGAAGQIWYLVAATWGLGGIGLAAVAAALGRRETRVTAAALLAVTCGIALASAAALPDEHRVGNFVYGRYLACLALVYALAGIAALVRLPLRRAAGLALIAAAVLAGTALGVRWYAGERLRTHAYIGFDFPEIQFLTGDRTAFDLAGATAATAGLLAAFLALRRVPGPSIAALLLAVNAGALVHVFGLDVRRPGAPPPLPLASGGVALDRSLPWYAPVKLAHPVWWTELSSFDVRTPPGPDICTVVVNRPAGTGADATWPGRPRGWRLADGQAGTWVVWYRSDCR